MAAQSWSELLEVRIDLLDLLDLPDESTSPEPRVQPSPAAAVTGRVQEASRRRLARAMERLRERAAARPPA